MELTKKLPPTNEQLVFITTYLAWVKVQAGIKNPSQEIMIQKYPLQTIYWLDTLHIIYYKEYYSYIPLIKSNKNFTGICQN